MIVKMTPVSQEFPGLEAIRTFTEELLGYKTTSPVFYDIETTGLSRSASSLYLAGAVALKDGQWTLFQWFGEAPQEEPQLLKAFGDFLAAYDCTIQYNGDSFDQPYLEYKYRALGMDSPFLHTPALDLYKTLKPLKNLLKLSQMKQPDLEAFLGLSRRRYCDGGQCIPLYQSYAKNRDPKIPPVLMGHNEEDLGGLGAVFSLLHYLNLLEGKFHVAQASYLSEEEQLLLTLKLPSALPVQISNGCQGFYFTAWKEEMKAVVPVKEGRLRQYYPNVKDYEYLPGEDTAIPRVLSAYMDKSLRQKATPQTCYTWFPCTQAFLQSTEALQKYACQTLPILMKFL